jgi:hypothetical protein
VSPVKYELGFYMPEDGILHNRRENLKSYKALTGWALYIPEDGIIHSHCRENLKSYTTIIQFQDINICI